MTTVGICEDDEELRGSLRVALERAGYEVVAARRGGEALTVEQLPEFLNRLAEQPLAAGKQKMDLRPDWRSTARRRGADRLR